MSAPSLGPYVDHGFTAAKRTTRLVAFAALQVQRAVTLRDMATFRPSCTSRDEAWVAQMVGEIQVRNDAC
jgi:hypothetical protein